MFEVMDGNAMVIPPWIQALPCQGEKSVGLATCSDPGWCFGTPMDPSTFLGSVWGIIYYDLEA
jgi:hypothetical protein